MSYILEALKKAEQKREEEEPSKVPTFLSGSVRESDRRVRYWPYVVAVALLLNASLVVWRLVPRQAPSTPPSAETGVRQEKQETSQAPLAPVKDIRKQPSSPAAHKESGPMAGPAMEAKPVVQSEVPAAAPQPRVEHPQPAPVGRPLSVNELSEPVVPQVKNGKPRATGRLFSLAELPPAVRGALPEFRVSGHAYTPEPQTRVVRINERILQEGQELTPGLRVEEIVQGGVIMSYGGYRFRINIKEN